MRKVASEPVSQFRQEAPCPIHSALSAEWMGDHEPKPASIHAIPPCASNHLTDEDLAGARTGHGRFVEAATEDRGRSGRLGAMTRGLFITLEGLDGSGKTTQIRKLATWLSRRGLDPVMTRQPGGTEIGDRVRAILLDARSTGLAPMTEMALMFADRAQAIAEVIEPALAEGRIVVCDRFTDSTEAYQGGGRQLGSEIVLELHRTICGGLQPDLTILLLPSFDASLSRARRRNTRTEEQTGANEDRFEQEQDEFHRRVWQKYSEIAAREPYRVVRIEGDLTIDEIHEQVAEAVAELLVLSGWKN